MTWLLWITAGYMGLTMLLLLGMALSVATDRDLVSTRWAPAVLIVFLAIGGSIMCAGMVVLALEPW